MSHVDIENCTKLVEIGTDGATANATKGGLKGLVESKCGCTFINLYLAHRLELAVKNALKITALDSVDDSLPEFYYLYENAQTNADSCASEIISDL